MVEFKQDKMLFMVDTNKDPKPAEICRNLSKFAEIFRYLPKFSEMIFVVIKRNLLIKTCINHHDIVR